MEANASSSGYSQQVTLLAVAVHYPVCSVENLTCVEQCCNCPYLLFPSGEARTMEMLEDCGGELQEFVSTCKGVFSSLVEKHFPVPNKKTKTIDIIGEMMSHSRFVDLKE